MSDILLRKTQLGGSSVVRSFSNRIGQNVVDIGFGDSDRGVVTKMKSSNLVIRYVPSKTEYSPQETEQLKEKEDALFNFIINQIMLQNASQN